MCRHHPPPLCRKRHQRPHDLNDHPCKKKEAIMQSKSAKRNKRMPLTSLLGLALPLAQVGAWAAPEAAPDLTQQIAETMLHAPESKAGFRPVHAKGIVCRGSFTASGDAATISRAAQFRGVTVPVTVRFSDGAPDPAISDSAPEAFPRGMAIRFMLPGGEGTDIVAISHNGFVVGTGEEFLAFLKAQAATDPYQPHPWPIEAFLAGHPRALKFAQDPKPLPTSFATETFFGNNAFRFVNEKGQKQIGRYRIVPVAGPHYLDDAAAKAKSPNFLFEELKTRLAQAPAKFRLLLQLPEPGDPIDDGSIVWPDDRRLVDLGTITITAVVPDSAAAERALAFDPTRLTDGIELSDDPLPALRSRVYALSVIHRRSHEAAAER
jgi:catalase